MHIPGSSRQPFSEINSCPQCGSDSARSAVDTLACSQIEGLVRIYLPGRVELFNVERCEQHRDLINCAEPDAPVNSPDRYMSGGARICAADVQQMSALSRTGRANFLACLLNGRRALRNTSE